MSERKPLEERRKAALDELDELGSAIKSLDTLEFLWSGSLDRAIANNDYQKITDIRHGREIRHQIVIAYEKVYKVVEDILEEKP